MANLLIVDDEQSYRQLLTLVFEGDGHNIKTAKNGREAIEILEQEPADLIISDVKMPDMNGIEMLRAAREFLPDIAVVLMTAFARWKPPAKRLNSARTILFKNRLMSKN